MSEPDESKTGYKPQTAAGREMVARRQARDAKNKHRMIWCTYKEDGTDFVLFGSETPALRYAVEHGMFCKAVDFGIPLSEQTK